ncbi:MAG: phosphoribosylanthranilate isomerase [Thermodesulfovibrio sp.]|nr:phosphoribosylanthranilate isomerase [Thermodesulfovibrio sp.]
MVKVKICGITNYDDAAAAVDAGADALGFVFFRESPRYVSAEDAGRIIRRLPPFVATVGVFVNEAASAIEETASIAGLTVVQLHGEESPDICQSLSVSRRAVKAFRVRSLDSLDEFGQYKDHVSAFLLDTYSSGAYGGTGQVFNWDIALEAKQYGRIILAGGLTPENVGEAVRHVRPYAVDVSSGVEAGRGKKDHLRMKQFIEQARLAGK